jgi:hypothetical protein
VIKIIATINELDVSKQNEINNTCPSIKEAQCNKKRRNKKECKNGVHFEFTHGLHPFKTIIMKEIVGLNK